MARVMKFTLDAGRRYVYINLPLVCRAILSDENKAQSDQKKAKSDLKVSVFFNDINDTIQLEGEEAERFLVEFEKLA
jgi:hypothetical protein